MQLYVVIFRLAYSYWMVFCSSIHVKTAYLLTRKQANNKSFFQKAQEHNAGHLLSILMIINNTCWEQELYLKSQNPTSLTFFHIILNCITFHFNKEISSDFKIKIVSSFFKLVTRSKIFCFSTWVSNRKWKKKVYLLS